METCPWHCPPWQENLEEDISSRVWLVTSRTSRKAPRGSWEQDGAGMKCREAAATWELNRCSCPELGEEAGEGKAKEAKEMHGSCALPSAIAWP